LNIPRHAPRSAPAVRDRRALVLAPPRRSTAISPALALPYLDAFVLGGGLIAVGQTGGWGIAYGVAAMVGLLSTGTYGNRITPRLSTDLPRLLAALAVPLLALTPFLRAAGLSAFVRDIPIVAVAVVTNRALVYATNRRWRRLGRLVDRTLIVGAGEIGVRTASILREHPELGLVPIGFVDHMSGADLTLPIVGGMNDLDYIIRSHGVDRIIIAFGKIREPEMIPVLRTCDRLSVEVHVLPRLFELGVAPETATTDDLWGVQCVRLRRAALRSGAWAVKRVFDVVVSGLLLILSAPVLALAALAVRLSGRGPIFHRQARVGQHGDVFELLKFRTMHVNSDADTTWSVADDERRTAAGKILRRTGLDELPQLINVLRGDMSLVGPRPERPHFVDRFRVAVQRYDDRHRVPAGITGWAQVHGLRGDTSIQERAVFDNHYVEHWSLWTDVLILLRTIPTLLRGDGR
jgi:exopolysaccharide biosynthesis polyprenyl glycosylphosphotransferase